MDDYNIARIDDRGRLKVPASLSEYFELSPLEADDTDIVPEAETVLDFSVGDWRLWSIEELLRSFDDEQA